MKHLLVFGAIALSACLVVPGAPEQPIEDSGTPVVDELAIVTLTLPNAVAGAEYSQQVLIRGGTPPYQFELANAPAWLSIQPQTGQLFGRPGAPHADVNATVTVRDAVGAKAATYAVRTTECQPGLRYSCSQGTGGVDGSCSLGSRLCQQDGTLGACVATGLSDDETRCGGACEPCGGSGLACVDGQCTCGATPNSSCGAGTSCCMSATGAACSDLTTDANNCGQCGAECRDEPALKRCGVCSAGECAAPQCCGGFADCDGDLGLCEVELAVTTAHCGACGNNCNDKPNVNVARCDNSQCFVEPGGCENLTSQFGDCNATGNDGCETNLSNDVNNCGSCGYSCAANNPGGNVASWQCDAGVCKVSTCQDDWHDCDPNVFGCEQPRNDSNCTACGDNCDTKFKVSTATCDLGLNACVVNSCQSGWDDCDNVGSNGCETDLLTDDNNCGFCGNLCGALTCVNGNCCTICTTGCNGTSIACCGGQVCAAGCTCSNPL